MGNDIPPKIWQDETLVGWCIGVLERILYDIVYVCFVGMVYNVILCHITKDYLTMHRVI